MSTTVYNHIAGIARIECWAQGYYIWCDRDQTMDIIAWCRADGLHVNRVTLPNKQVKLFAHY